MLVDSKEDQKVINRYTDQRRMLVDELNARGFNAASSPNLPVDVMWSADGRTVMFDLATPEDMIHKADDGRLHSQTEAMKAHDCLLWGFLVEGVSGDSVGYGKHAWPHARYDNLIVSLQRDGATIATSPHISHTPERLGSLYTWSGKDSHASWQSIKPHTHLTGVYLDKTYRAQVGMLMAFPGMGEAKAIKALAKYSLGVLLCVDDEFEQRWASIEGIGKPSAQRWHKFLTEAV